MFVAFSCKQRCTCPSCHQKRTLLTSLHVAQEVCSPFAHRQVVLTIPKRLRVHTRFDRGLLGKLPSLVLESDPAYSGHSLDAPVEADESQELTYVDIDTFLASF